MPRYNIQGIVAADTHLGEIEADSAQEAIKLAWEQLDCGTPPICHQCSRHVNLGDVYQLVAHNTEDDTDYAESD